MESLAYEIKTLIAQVEQSLPGLLAVSTLKSPLLADRELLASAIALLADLGHAQVAFELCETASRSWKVDQQDPWLLLCKVYLAHRELSFARNLETNAHFFSSLSQTSSTPLLVAHAHSGLGLIKVYQGQLDAASHDFKEAREYFLRSDAVVDALKMSLRSIMLLRMQRLYDEAHAGCLEVLKNAQELGAKAIAPRLLALATLGSNCIETQKRYEALRFLQDAAKIARHLPACSTAAFAFFHYGHALEGFNRNSEAILWLGKAEAIQKRVDPVARTATLIALLRCQSHTRNWPACFEIINTLMASTHRVLDADNLFEVFEESLKVLLHTHNIKAARALVEKAGEAKLEKFEKLEFTVTSYVNLWRHATYFPATGSATDSAPRTDNPAFLEGNTCAQDKNSGETFFLDFTSGEFLKRDASGALFELTALPSSFLALALLTLVQCKASECSFQNEKLKEQSEKLKERSSRGVTFKNLMDLFSAHTPVGKSTRADSARRHLERVLTRLTTQGFVVESKKGDESRFSFPEQASVACLFSATAKLSATTQDEGKNHT